MNHCKTCKNYEPFTKEYDIKSYGKVGNCSSNKFSVGEHKMMPDEISGRDSDDHMDACGAVRVGEEFGCIHWAAIE